MSVDNSLQRSIEYAGKRGSVVNFVYSEFSNGLARDAFTREFGVDLDDGPTAGYKDPIFEIIQANNSEITYKMIQHFPQ